MQKGAKATEMDAKWVPKSAVIIDEIQRSYDKEPRSPFVVIVGPLGPAWAQVDQTAGDVCLEDHLRVLIYMFFHGFSKILAWPISVVYEKYWALGPSP